MHDNYYRPRKFLSSRPNSWRPLQKLVNSRGRGQRLRFGGAYYLQTNKAKRKNLRIIESRRTLNGGWAQMNFCWGATLGQNLSAPTLLPCLYWSNFFLYEARETSAKYFVCLYVCSKLDFLYLCLNSFLKS